MVVGTLRQHDGDYGPGQSKQWRSFVSIKEKVAELADELEASEHAFPELFQILFRIPMVMTDQEGPSVDTAQIAKVYAPDSIDAR